MFRGLPSACCFARLDPEACWVSSGLGKRKDLTPKPCANLPERSGMSRPDPNLPDWPFLSSDRYLTLILYILTSRGCNATFLDPTRVVYLSGRAQNCFKIRSDR